jgi:hypothetical protein
MVKEPFGLCLAFDFGFQQKSKFISAMQDFFFFMITSPIMNTQLIDLILTDFGRRKISAVSKTFLLECYQHK